MSSPSRKMETTTSFESWTEERKHQRSRIRDLLDDLKGLRHDRKTLKKRPILIQMHSMQDVSLELEDIKRDICTVKEKIKCLEDEAEDELLRYLAALDAKSREVVLSEQQLQTLVNGVIDNNNARAREGSVVFALFLDEMFDRCDRFDDGSAISVADLSTQFMLWTAERKFQNIYCDIVKEIRCTRGLTTFHDSSSASFVRGLKPKNKMVIVSVKLDE